MPLRSSLIVSEFCTVNNKRPDFDTCGGRGECYVDIHGDTRCRNCEAGSTGRFCELPDTANGYTRLCADLPVDGNGVPLPRDFPNLLHGAIKDDFGASPNEGCWCPAGTEPVVSDGSDNPIACELPICGDDIDINTGEVRCNGNGCLNRLTDECECDAAYYGVDCGFAHNDCTIRDWRPDVPVGADANHFRCVDEDATVDGNMSLVCAQGWVDALCDREATGCDLFGGCNGYSCIETPAPVVYQPIGEPERIIFHCDCSPPDGGPAVVGGENCADDVDLCLPPLEDWIQRRYVGLLGAACENASPGGVGLVECVNAYMEPDYCVCESGFEPPHCANIDECAGGADCGAGGTCVDTVGSYRCECDIGYANAGDAETGACDVWVGCAGAGPAFTCETVTEATRPPDGGHGACVEAAPDPNSGAAGSLSCTCPIGFRHEAGLCVEDATACGDPGCGAGQTCRAFDDPADGVACFCAPGLAGEACNEVVGCDMVEGIGPGGCDNGSECLEVVGSNRITFECDCGPAAAFTGPNCATEADHCQVSPFGHAFGYGGEVGHACFVASPFGEGMADCVNTFGGQDYCVCNDGYEPPLCVDIDECAAAEPACAHPTQQCVNTGGGFTCDTCKPGYESSDDSNACDVWVGCASDAFTCATDSPLLGAAAGTCVETAADSDGVLGVYCDCPTGFRAEGGLCVADATACGGVCGPAQTCAPFSDPVQCLCPVGWSGADCDVPVTSCAWIDNVGPGGCLAGRSDCEVVYSTRAGLETPTGVTCVCRGLYTGDNCEDVRPCHNGIASARSNGEQWCNCKPGWTGDICDVRQSTVPRPTRDGRNSFAPWVAENHWRCPTAADVALERHDMECLNGGVCVETMVGAHPSAVDCLDTTRAGRDCPVVYYGTRSCDCPLGWSGDNCERYDGCADPSVCPNQDCADDGGAITCSGGCDDATLSAFSCGRNEFSNEWYGTTTCSYDRDSSAGIELTCTCAELLDVTAISHADHVSLPAYSGADCSAPTSACADIGCLNGGRCSQIFRGGSRCVCPNGFSGLKCEVDINECAPDPCGPNGTCEDRRGGFNCECDPGYAGELCDVDIDACLAGPCLNGATCEDGDGEDYTCTCAAGFTGTDCEIDIDDCSPNPCLNGGACTDGVDSYECACVPGFVGAICATNINDCAGVACLNGGTCVDGVGSFSCSCPTGTTGTYCEDEDSCVGDPCNGGTCTDLVGGFRCDCSGVPRKGPTCSSCPLLSQTGDNCDEVWDKEDIVEQNWNLPGDPNFFDIRGTARCPEGYAISGFKNSGHIGEISTSFLWNIDAAYCTKLPPSWTGGAVSCELLDDSEDWDTSFDDWGWSVCKPGSYISGLDRDGTDDPAQTNFADVQRVNLLRNAECCSYTPAESGGEPLETYGACQIVDVSSCWHGEAVPTGFDCSVSYPSCPAGTFLTGLWRNGNNGHEPLFVVEFMLCCGPDETDYCTDANANDLCKNGGTCIEKSARRLPAQQAVLAGFGGEREDVVIGGTTFATRHTDEVAMNLVWDNVDEDGSAYCACPAEWTGPTCSTPVTGCDSNPCGEHGSCTPGAGIDDFSCECDDGWTGERCGQDTDFCVGNPCGDNGLCIDGETDFACICEEGYDGVPCADVDDCAGDPCGAHGSCTDNVGSFECSCQPGYSGRLCDTDINECDGVVCANGGSCVDGVDGFTCSCTPGWSGTHCSVVVNACEPNPCKNSGTCLQADVGGPYACDCPSGWTGDACEIDIDECCDTGVESGCNVLDGNNECGVGSVGCTNLPGGYSCQCGEGFDDAFCEACEGDNPCENGGICHGTPDGGSWCECPDAWTGSTCGDDVDECTGASDDLCGHGTCLNTVGGYICECDNGWGGTACNTLVDCSLVPLSLYERSSSAACGSAYECHPDPDTVRSYAFVSRASLATWAGTEPDLDENTGDKYCLRRLSEQSCTEEIRYCEEDWVRVCISHMFSPRICNPPYRHLRVPMDIDTDEELSTEEASDALLALFEDMETDSSGGRRRLQAGMDEVYDFGDGFVLYKPDVYLKRGLDPTGSSFTLVFILRDLPEHDESSVISFYNTMSEVVDDAVDGLPAKILSNTGKAVTVSADVPVMQSSTASCGSCSPPAITAPPPVVLSCGVVSDADSISPDVTGYASASGECGLARVEYADGAADGCAIGSGPTSLQRAWFVDDSCGQSSVALQKISVIDPGAIVMPDSVALECGAPNLRTDTDITGVPTQSSSACGQQYTFTFEDHEEASCGASYTLLRTWTAASECGSLAGTQTIAVYDSQPPDVVAPPDATVAFSEQPSPAVTGAATASDDCSPGVTLSYEDSARVPSADPALDSTFTRTWTATDECGLQGTATQTIAVEACTTGPGGTVDGPFPRTYYNDDGRNPSFTDVSGNTPIGTLPNSPVSGTDIYLRGTAGVVSSIRYLVTGYRFDNMYNYLVDLTQPHFSGATGPIEDGDCVEIRLGAAYHWAGGDVGTCTRAAAVVHVLRIVTERCDRRGRSVGCASSHAVSQSLPARAINQPVQTARSSSSTAPTARPSVSRVRTQRAVASNPADTASPHSARREHRRERRAQD